jgi:hypothetical protein
VVFIFSHVVGETIVGFSGAVVSTIFTILVTCVAVFQLVSV